jgi:hypothetical protein
MALGFRPNWFCYQSPDKTPANCRFCIVDSGFFGSSYGSTQSLPSLPLGEFEGVPILFGRPRVERRGDCVVLHADLLASAFFLATRYEEWVRSEVRDRHGRFPGRESLPYRAGFLHRPILEEYAILLRKYAAEAGVDLPRPKRKFSVLLTHDVDSLGAGSGIMNALKALGNSVLGRLSASDALRAAARRLGWRNDPMDNLHEVAGWDNRLLKAFPDRAKAHYFFLAAKNSNYDRCCDLDDPKTRKAIHAVKEAGAIIGLHASYEAGMQPEKINDERQRLETVSGMPIHHNRHHYLGWRETRDGHALAASGIDWDSTLGYADVAGFRLGVCRPIPLFEPEKQCLLGVEEHPLAVMDTALSAPDYLNLDEESAFEQVRRLADAVKKHEGELVISWHNYTLASNYPSYHRRLYPRILEYIAGLF